MSNPRLDQLPNVWRASTLARTHSQITPTGFAALDDAMGGGWPATAFIELLTDQYGIGELQLLMPLIRARQQSRTDSGRIVLWLHPPCDVHAVALMQWGLDPSLHWVSGELTPTETLWAAEQALKANVCAGVVAWVDRTSMATLRRLKLALQSSDSFVVLFRVQRERTLPSPATIRAVLSRSLNGLEIELIKVTGALPRTVTLQIHCDEPDRSGSASR